MQPIDEDINFLFLTVMAKLTLKNKRNAEYLL